MPLNVEVVPNGPFVENAMILWDEDTKKAVVIDPGFEAKRIFDAARVLGLDIIEIVGTHGHIDHIGAVAEFKEISGAPFALHKAEEPMLAHLSAQAAMFGLGQVEAPEVERWLDEDDVIEVGGIKGKVIHTPGHTPGGICLYFEEEKILIAGDTLFQGSIGRTDLPGGSFSQLKSSIFDKLFTLDDRVIVYCGHGGNTNIGIEKKINMICHM